MDPASIRLAGFGLADGQSIADNQLALGMSLTRQGDLKGAVAAFTAGLDLYAQTTSYGVGTLGNSQYGWYIFNRESIDQDVLPGLDDPIYTDGVVRAMLTLADDYQKLGDPGSARQVYEKVGQVAPDYQGIPGK